MIMGFLALLGTGELYVLMLVAIIFFVIPIVALIDILKSEFEGNNKLIWVLVVLLSWIIGAVIYFVIGRKQKINN
jgi:predicted membrane channel-forming protein YqfA (hemolysin III family)